MKGNIGTTDRVVRIGAGVVLIGLAASGAIGGWGYLGILPLLTGLFRFCPAYALYGFDTCPARRR